MNTSSFVFIHLQIRGLFDVHKHCCGQAAMTATYVDNIANATSSKRIGEGIRKIAEGTVDKCIRKQRQTVDLCICGIADDTASYGKRNPKQTACKCKRNCRQTVGYGKRNPTRGASAVLNYLAGAEKDRERNRNV